MLTHKNDWIWLDRDWEGTVLRQRNQPKDHPEVREKMLHLRSKIQAARRREMERELTLSRGLTERTLKVGVNKLGFILWAELTALEWCSLAESSDMS